MIDHFHSDRPLHDISEDMFSRNSFVELLYREVKAIPDTESVAIGLSGSWGSGKTSIINMVCQKLEIDRAGRNLKPGDTIVVRFSPWNQISPDKHSEEFFIRSFFDALRKQLREDKDEWYISTSSLNELSESIDEYIDLINPGFLKSTISIATRVFKNYSRRRANTIPSAKKAIKEVLGNFEIKILVVIDDIDRLPREQIQLIFQLITAIADFESVNYLIAYDQAVVEKAVCSIQGMQGRDYLEKVIQVPLAIPKPSLSALHAVIDRRFGYIPNQYYATENESTSAALRFSQLLPLLQQGISSIRQINRLENALRLKLPVMSEILDAIDILAMEYLRIVFPEVLLWIVKHRDDLCVDRNSNAPVVGLSPEATENLKQFFHAELKGQYPNATELFKFVALIFMWPRRVSEANRQRSYDVYRAKSISYPALFEFFLTNDENDTVSLSDIALIYLKSHDEEALSSLFQGTLGHNAYLNVIESIGALENCLNESDVKFAAKALAQNIPLAEHEEVHFSENTRTTDIIEALLKKIGDADRNVFVLDLFENLDSLSTIFMAEFIIRRERAYERNRFSGGSYEKLILEDSVETLELQFVDAMAALYSAKKLPFIPNIYPQMILWRNIDEEGYRAALETVSRDAPKVVLYALSFVSTGRSLGSNEITSFMVSHEVFDYGRKDILIHATEEMASSNTFRKLPISTRRKVAAMCIALSADGSPDSIVDRVDIEEVNQWIDEYQRASGPEDKSWAV